MENKRANNTNIWELMVLTIFVSIMFLTALFVWHEIEISKLEAQNRSNINTNSINVPNNNRLNDFNPKYCELDSDCVAVEHPNNSCYKDFFKKTATGAIEEYKNSFSGLTLPGCPVFGEAVCVNNTCTHSQAR